MRARPRPFDTAVYRLLRTIPAGRVVTYGELARRLGRPRAARAVGAALRRCPPELPWHRVVNARGGVSPRAGDGPWRQRWLLLQEGVRLIGGRVDLARQGWRDPRPGADGR